MVLDGGDPTVLCVWRPNTSTACESWSPEYRLAPFGLNASAVWKNTASVGFVTVQTPETFPMQPA